MKSVISFLLLFQEISFDLIFSNFVFICASHYRDIPRFSGVADAVQLVQSGELQVWMTILHNDILKHRNAPEQ